jgi:hypothetical protein
MNFRYVFKKAPSSSKLPSNKWHSDTFILKGINGSSIGNAFECHVRRARETRATGKMHLHRKSSYLGTISQQVTCLIMTISRPTSLKMCVRSWNPRVDPTYRSWDMAILSQKVRLSFFVIYKLGNFASRKNSLDPRFWMINQYISTGGGWLLVVKETPKV